MSKHQMSSSSRNGVESGPESNADSGSESVDAQGSSGTTAANEDAVAESSIDVVEDYPDRSDTDGAQKAEDLSPRKRPLSRIAVFAVLPILALLLAAGAGFLDWRHAVAKQDAAAQGPAVQAAKDGAVAILSYQPDTADKDLGAATDRLTGPLRYTFTTFTHDVVIPSAKEKKISAVAMVPAAAPMSIQGTHAQVMVFVNQAITVGNDAPSSTVSSVKVTLDEVDGRWLISGFEPI